jgi:carbamoyl-phosphate synthase large subunit
MRILLSSVGRRGYLVKYFKQAIGADGEVWGADSSPYVSAFQYCDKSVLLPPVTDCFYVEQLIKLCRDSHIDMVVPLIDPELEVLAAHIDKFHDNAIMAVVSPKSTIDFAYDKYETYLHAKKSDIAVPETVTTIDEAIKLVATGGFAWPLMVKPRKGSASSSITYCRDENELRFAFHNCPGPMIQQFAPGEEYGFDLFCDRDFKPISVFCKRKIAMRAGETDKAVSVNDKKLIDLGVKIARAFPFLGPADVDVKMLKGTPVLLEINPRFGGGYPCTHLSGGDFPAKLVAICKGEKLTPDIGDYKAGVYMFKQDEIISWTEENIKTIADHRKPRKR